MNEERKKILDMLAKGKITVDEADQLLTAIKSGSEAEQSSSAESVTAAAGAVKSPKFLRILVQSSNLSEKGPETVNIRVPFQLLRSGIKLASLMPADVQDKVNSAIKEKGIDLDLSKAKPEHLEGLMNDLAQLSIDVDGPKEKVRIFCE